MIIYSPIIADTIPAFTSDAIKIPFQNNPGVGWDEVLGFQVIFKDYKTSKPIITQNVFKTSSGAIVFDERTNKGIIKLAVSNDKLQKKSYYKIQISYLSENTASTSSEQDTEYLLSPPSVVSIGKCIGSTPPSLKIAALDEDTQEIKAHLGAYNIEYVMGEDNSEILYQYSCVLSKRNEDNTIIIQDSGEQLYTHNATMEFVVAQDLPKEKYKYFQHNINPLTHTNNR